MLIPLDGRLVKEHPARLAIDGFGWVPRWGVALRALLGPMPKLPAAKAWRQLRAVAREVAIRVAVAADHLCAVARPMPKLPAARALVARPCIPPPWFTL